MFLNKGSPLPSLPRCCLDMEVWMPKDCQHAILRELWDQLHSRDYTNTVELLLCASGKRHFCNCEGGKSFRACIVILLFFFFFVRAEVLPESFDSSSYSFMEKMEQFVTLCPNSHAPYREPLFTGREEEGGITIWGCIEDAWMLYIVWNYISGLFVRWTRNWGNYLPASN